MPGNAQIDDVEDFKMKPNIKHNFLGYYKFFYKVLGPRFLLDLLLSICVSFLDGIGLAMFIPLLQAMNNNSTPGSNQSMGSLQFLTDFFHSINFQLNIYNVLIMLVALFVAKGIIKFGQLYSQVNLKQTFIKKIRYDLTDDLQHLSYEGFLSLNAGKIQNIVTSEVQKLQTSLSHYLNSVSAVGMLLTYVTMAFLANWEFALLVAFGSVITNLLFSKLIKNVKAASFKISSRGNVFNAYLIEAVHFFKYLKATNSFESFTKKIKTVIKETEDLNRNVGFYQAVSASIREPLVLIIVASVIFIQLKWMGGNLGSVIVSLLLFYRALTFLMNFQNSWQNFMQNVGAIEAVSNFSAEMKSHKEHLTDNSYKGFSYIIEIKDLIFKYGESVVINSVNLAIPKNNTIALVGESGSGKTTLANILTGILHPFSGSILLDGIDVSNYNLDTYRSKIGYISQEAVIFKDDVFNNITFWSEPSAENIQKFWEVVELASLTDFVLDMPQKEKTSLGDKGMLISGGQKQRISIARELFKDSEILILDEATSALDSETELYIQQNIDKLKGKYTIIIIAHRLSTIKKADQIYMLEKGSVSHSGTFDELLTRSSRFKRMVSLQQI
jgi:ABC-type multidrug transport system fused ATPase/permease subunit